MTCMNTLGVYTIICMSVWLNLARAHALRTPTLLLLLLLESTLFVHIPSIHTHSLTLSYHLYTHSLTHSLPTQPRLVVKPVKEALCIMGGFFNSLSSYFGSSSSDTHHSTYTGGRAAAADSGPSGGPNSSGGGGFGRNRSSGAFGFNNNRDVLAATRDAFSLPSHHGPYHDTSLNGSRSGSPGASYTEGTGGLTPLGRANLSVSGGFSFLFFECLGTRWAGYGMCRVYQAKKVGGQIHTFLSHLLAPSPHVLRTRKPS